MPATPAYPPQSTPRLYVETPLEGAAEVRITDAQAHYLLHVMRLREGDPLKLFDNASGEWLGVVAAIGKRDLIVALEGRLRDYETVPDLWLAAAPIRRARYDWVAEKACELGVARFIPVLTARAVVDKVKPDKLRAHMVEAAEQCGRTALPDVAEPMKLAAFLDELGARMLFFADEAANGEGGLGLLAAVQAHSGPACILIGPEGGFDEEERVHIRAHPHTVAVTLGPRILRADTAAVAALAVWLSVHGRAD
ncbi:MAG: 16S rRNA (uracil(1498)-N(3))-methyltransferase [Alphaproteobacteria bacterium]|nr:16S rRNA (uracil(1498)-N(3))-methyltransferase [Alphaproteobacteria bacterium]MDE2041814.1 16S rRNA (uracil(1498)-N(3))-methyltransferase [Alphaproteobacteria bacterium]MDE2341331.1 16S rRNA (uracil(1498)-N(3))-methyltransferase [Alphaproteobacteria bacterium]